ENAVKYSPEEAIIHLNAIAGPKELQMEISDQGSGIPEKEKNKVIQQFYRIGNEDTRQTKGTGLGLYIVDKIIKAHKGTLKIQDNQPKGTKFTITLPIKQ
ncbi:MAG: ATP-binding protein, partial [Saprospiraceae bacterium]|nr:ATP-binding protein [Saprospiraceae bacterium]